MRYIQLFPYSLVLVLQCHFDLIWYFKGLLIDQQFQQLTIKSGIVITLKRTKDYNETYLQREVCCQIQVNHLKSISKKSQDLFHRITAINRYYLNVDCGLLPSDKCCEIFVLISDDGTEYHHDCGLNERCLNLNLHQVKS